MVLCFSGHTFRKYISFESGQKHKLFGKIANILQIPIIEWELIKGWFENKLRVG